MLNILPFQRISAQGSSVSNVLMWQLTFVYYQPGFNSPLKEENLPKLILKPKNFQFFLVLIKKRKKGKMTVICTPAVK